MKFRNPTCGSFKTISLLCLLGAFSGAEFNAQLLLCKLSFDKYSLAVAGGKNPVKDYLALIGAHRVSPWKTVNNIWTAAPSKSDVVPEDTESTSSKSVGHPVHREADSAKGYLKILGVGDAKASSSNNADADRKGTNYASTHSHIRTTRCDQGG